MNAQMAEPPKPQYANAMPPPYNAAPQTVNVLGPPTFVVMGVPAQPQEQRLELDRYPQAVQCPACHQQMTTRVVYKSGLFAWVASGVICFFGGILGCCLIPFCVDTFKDAHVFCSSCNAPLGIKEVIKL